MWATEETGLASWRQGTTRVDVDARGGHVGLGLALAGDRARSVLLQPVGDDSLPEVAEEYVRGDEWHISCPQTHGTFSLDAVFRPVRTTPDCLVLETTLAIHTSLLDSHPMLDVCVDGPQSRHWLTGIEPAAAPASGGCAAATRTQPGTNGSPAVAVLLGPPDRAFTQDRSSADQLRLRLFGGFLEKGVIRKARPWIVLGSCSDEMLVELWHELCASPLPLAT